MKSARTSPDYGLSGVQMKTVGCLAALLMILSVVPTSASEFHVAPNGSDANPGTKDKPFASIARARDAVRQAKAASEGPISVWVRGGTYYLEQALKFGTEDSGTEKSPIVYAASEGEKAILSGGREVAGWKPFRGPIWQCDLKAMGLKTPAFKELYYNGRGQPLARVPNVDPKHPRTGGFLYLADGGQPGNMRSLKYNPAKLDPSKWKHREGAEVVVFPYHNWDNQVIPIAKVDLDNHVITLGADARWALFQDARFYIWNVFEELDSPGEWYLDQAAGTLYFWPPDDGLLRGSVVVPTTDTVIEIKGDAASKTSVRYLEFRGFTIQACRGPAVTLREAEHCTIAKSSITNIGYAGGAVALVYAGGAVALVSSRSNRVVGNDIAYTGTAGVNVADDCDGNLISNNHIHDVGQVLREGSAINIGGRAQVVSHNLIHDVPCVGITFCGMKNSNRVIDNIFEYNEIHHVGLESNIPAGMFAGIARENINNTKGNIVRFNKISDAVGYGLKTFPTDIEVGKWGPNFGMGIWLDDYVSKTTVYGNILVRNRGCGVVIHGGTDNLVENNIMGTGISAGINHIWPGKEPCNNRIVRNIVYYSNVEPRSAWLYGWTEEAKTRADRGDAIPVSILGWTFYQAAVVESDYNLLFPIHGTNVETLYFFRGAAKALMTGAWANTPVADRFAWWRQQGFETHSIVGDPLFVDASKDDFRLRPESPALKLGFKPIPVEKIGLQPDSDRASWPVDSGQDRWREEPEANPQ